MKRIICLLIVSLFVVRESFAQDFWVNDLRTLFASNRAVIYAINIRSFNAKDLNANDIIEIDQNETKGSFLNAIGRLDELTQMGVNTVYLLPITKVGKLKALGTAGSLYAMDSFDTLNPQLDDVKNKASVYDEAVLFINEAHRRGLRVMVDMPSCGSYDLYLEKPNLFVKGKDGVYPADWTDVRLFRVYEDDGKTLNPDLLDGYKKFINLMISLDVDGIRADVAAIMPYEFWKELIDYTRRKSPQFLFLAEASHSWENPAPGHAPYIGVEELLNAGFDGYYSDWMNFSKMKKAKDVTDTIERDLALAKKYNRQKSTMATFATHDQLSPLLVGKTPYWEMLTWLNVTLPLNSYVLDGYATGDTYIYRYERRKAAKTFTDDDIYFVHRGKLDIFNFSRKPQGPQQDLYDQFVKAMKFKYWAKNILIDGNYTTLATGSKSVFAFSRNLGDDSIVVVGNLDSINSQITKVAIPKLSTQAFVSPVKITIPPVTKKGGLEVKLKPYEIQVFIITKEQGGIKLK